MKRLVWLFLAAFCTALAQMQPVDLEITKAKACHCCEVPGACGMPDCVPVPVHARQMVSLSNQGRLVRVAAKPAAAARVVHEKFYVQFLPRISVAPALPVTLAVATPASVPLFQEHCSWLI